MTEQKPKWGALGYEPVPGLINRHISRYLRAQRKNMRKFFDERGYSEYWLRLEAIRKNPRLGMIKKNQQFKRVLDEYAAERIAQSTPVAAPEASATVAPEQPGRPELDVRAEGAALAAPAEDHVGDTGGGVPELARDDGAEPVV